MEPGQQREAGNPAGDVDPGDGRTGVINPNPGANNGFTSSSTTEKPNAAAIQVAPGPQGRPEPPPESLPEPGGPALEPPPIGGHPGPLGYHPPTNRVATVTSTQRLTTPTEALTTTGVPCASYTHTSLSEPKGNAN